VDDCICTSGCACKDFLIQNAALKEVEWQPGNVAHKTRREIVNDGDRIAVIEEPANQIRPYESGATSYEYSHGVGVFHTQ